MEGVQIHVAVNQGVVGGVVVGEVDELDFNAVFRRKLRGFFPEALVVADDAQFHGLFCLAVAAFSAAGGGKEEAGA